MPNLILSRKTGERVYIGADVILEVRKITESRVTVAIEAPEEVSIRRSELELEKGGGE